MKYALIAILTTTFLGASALPADAQMMRGFSNTSVDWDEVVEHTLREEQEGKELWDRIQAEEIACAELSEEQFGVLGEYYMGQMMGDAHAAMNAMMIQAHGEEGEEQIHVVMGQRLSGCDTSAAAIDAGAGWLPMMQMMGGWMSFGVPSAWASGTIGWLAVLTKVVWLIAGILLIVWLVKKLSK